MILNKIFAILIGVLLVCSSCKKDLPEVNATIKDFTGFDGCGIMMVLDSGEKLEIASLPQNATLIANRRVAIKYKIVFKASICMSGSTVEITSLRYL